MKSAANTVPPPTWKECSRSMFGESRENSELAGGGERQMHELHQPGLVSEDVENGGKVMQKGVHLDCSTRITLSRVGRYFNCNTRGVIGKFRNKSGVKYFYLFHSFFISILICCVFSGCWIVLANRVRLMFTRCHSSVNLDKMISTKGRKEQDITIKEVNSSHSKLPSPLISI